jgi:hypothetical protein
MERFFNTEQIEPNSARSGAPPVATAPCCMDQPGGRSDRGASRVAEDGGDPAGVLIQINERRLDRFALALSSQPCGELMGGSSSQASPVLVENRIS